ncbi:MAG: undecaprenyl-diphosphate phosphatase [Betaproteobacteria bacterium]|nr:undecaprenyl-diphosphate phosphatase [Betaproteobacteria bacterium]
MAEALMHPWLQALILGLVEGLTEFLPISSTGHLILVGSLIGFHGEKAKLFDVAIQTGAMLAVIWFYRERLLGALRGSLGASLFGAASSRRDREESWRLLLNLMVAFCPAVILGLLLGSTIKRYLFYPVPVALAFVIGGVIILWAEARAASQRHPVRVHSIDRLSGLDALKVGLMQCFALIPGTSRSGATIIGGMFLGLSRKTATEFSFFLAIPTLIGAGIYDTWKYRNLLSLEDLPMFAIGLVAAFVSALFVVRWLIRFVAQHSFVAFAWYRIVAGSIALAWLLSI